MAKFTKYSNPNRKRYKKSVTRSEYIPTLGELKSCEKHGITPTQYLELKFEKK